MSSNTLRALKQQIKRYGFFYNRRRSRHESLLTHERQGCATTVQRYAGGGKERVLNLPYFRPADSWWDVILHDSTLVGVGDHL